MVSLRDIQQEVVITDQMVQSAIAEGFSFVCANCRKLWWGASQKRQCRARFEGKTCGGPIMALDFPEYEGLLTDGMLMNFCFVDGVESTGAVQFRQNPDARGRLIGFCPKHGPEWIQEMQKSETGLPRLLGRPDNGGDHEG